jgi:hypothetical protein
MIDNRFTLKLQFSDQTSIVPVKPAFVVVSTDKICGRRLSSKIPVDMNSIFMKWYVT